MRTSLLPFLLTLPLLACSSDDSPAPTPTPSAPTELKSALQRDQAPAVAADAQQAVVLASTELALHMLRAQPAADNAILSPHSLMTAMAMAEAGAANSSKSEMRTAMQLPGSLGEALHPALNALDLALARHAATLVDRESVRPAESGPQPSPRPGALAIANGVFQQQNMDVLPSYLDTLAVNYGAGVQLVDFLGQPEASTDSINAWIGDQTRGLIPKFFNEPLEDKTRLVLLNALYFNGAFASPFDVSKSGPLAFTAPSGVRQVDSVRQRASLRFAEVGGAKLVEVPFAGAGQRLALTVLLPPGEIGAYEASLDAASLHAALDALALPAAGGEVALQLPKLKLKPAENMSFNKPLEALGMVAPFKASLADFSAMTPNGQGLPGERLYVASVEQRTTFDLDEYGVEASAVTAVIMAGETASPVDEEPVFSLSADRPFLVVLRDNESGQILFLGRVTEPAID